LNVPPPDGTTTVNILTELMHGNVKDACPAACGCETLTTASTTVHRSGHDART
jgi:hypothetical protein